MLAGDQYERAERLQKKMIANLAMAKDRLALLGSLTENRKHIKFLLSHIGTGDQYICLFLSAEATLKSERASSPPQTSNHTLPQPKHAPRCQPTVRPSTNTRRPTSRPADQKVTLLITFDSLLTHGCSVYSLCLCSFQGNSKDGKSPQ